VIGLGVRVVGRRIFPYLPFEEGFFLPFARQFREELSMPLVLLGGINERATIDGAMGEGFDFVAMARALLREPDLVNRLAAGSSDAGICIHCNKCMPTIYSGTRCVLVPRSEPAA
jgi:2,4-dienoyl-CoA reductase-like NADH-dependent reductase (Old Yellow Enzyme family)